MEFQPLPITFANILLGYKYEFLKLRDDAISRLKHEYPSELKDVKTVYTRLEVDTDADKLDILNLAQGYDQLRTTLPYLYSDICARHTLVWPQFELYHRFPG